jgi:hypothetical protein
MARAPYFNRAFRRSRLPVHACMHDVRAYGWGDNMGQACSLANSQPGRRPPEKKPNLLRRIRSGEVHASMHGMLQFPTASQSSRSSTRASPSPFKTSIISITLDLWFSS